MGDQQDDVMLTGHVEKTILAMAVPTALGFLSLSLVYLVDAYFIGLLGKHALAAVGLATPINLFVVSFSGGIAMACTAKASTAFGKGDRSEAVRVISDSLLLAVLVCFCVVTLVLLLLPVLLLWMNAGPEVLPLAKSYLTISLFAQIGLSVLFVTNGALRAYGDTRTPGFVLTFAAIVNCLGDYLFVQGNWGAPALGVQGAALATLSAWVFSGAYVVWCVAFRDSLLKIQVLEYIREVGAVVQRWWEILCFGAPLMLSRVMLPVSTMIVVAVITSVGEAENAAYTVASRVEEFLMLAGIAINLVLMVFVGRNLGAEKFGRVRRALRFSFRQSLVWGLFCWGFLFVCAAPIASNFSQDSTVITHIIFCLCVIPIRLGGRIYVIQTSGILTALEQPLEASFLQVAHGLIMTVPLIMLGKFLGGFEGIIVGLVIAGVLGFPLGHYWLKLRAKLPLPTGDGPRGS